MSDTPKDRYAEALAIANDFIEEIRPYCRRVEIAGSLRRHAPLIGDIEIVAIPWRPVDLFGEERIEGTTDLDRHLDTLPRVNFMSRGRKYQRINYDWSPATPPMMSIDLFLPTAATWGSIYTIRTGSWEFSRWLVTPEAGAGASPRGLIFREGLLYHDGRLLCTPDEEDVFKALGLAYIPPKERTGVPTNPVRMTPVWNYAV